ALDTVEVPVNPDRIVVLSFGALENLSLINANVVGIPKTGLPDYLAQYDTDSVVNLGNLVQVSLEKINALQPDLIISGPRLSDSYDALSEIAPTIMPESFIEEGQLSALKSNLADLGKIFGKDAQKIYQKKLAELQKKAKAVHEKATKSGLNALVRSEERRVGKECRTRCWTGQNRKTVADKI